MSGKPIWANILNSPAPSILAASANSLGKLCSHGTRIKNKPYGLTMGVGDATKTAFTSESLSA
jgi:hypothetical protein